MNENGEGASDRERITYIHMCVVYVFGWYVKSTSSEAVPNFKYSITVNRLYQYELRKIEFSSRVYVKQST